MGAIGRRLEYLERSAAAAVAEMRAKMAAVPDEEIAQLVYWQRTNPDDPDLHAAWMRAWDRWGISEELAAATGATEDAFAAVFRDVNASPRRGRINAEIRRLEEDRAWRT